MMEEQERKRLEKRREEESVDMTFWFAGKDREETRVVCFIDSTPVPYYKIIPMQKSLELESFLEAECKKFKGRDPYPCKVEVYLKNDIHDMGQRTYPIRYDSLLDCWVKTDYSVLNEGEYPPGHPNHCVLYIYLLK